MRYGAFMSFIVMAALPIKQANVERWVAGSNPAMEARAF